MPLAIRSGHSMFVYLVSNIVTGKRYVGKTEAKISARWKQHIWLAGHGGTTPFARAIRKYGADQFMVSELAEVDNSADLRLLEAQFIAALSSKCPDGYNLTDGGEGCRGIKRSAEYLEGLRERAVKRWADPAWAAETRQKRRENQRPMDDAMRAAISATLKAKNLTGERSPTFGKKLPADRRERMRLISIERWKDPEHRKLQSARHVGKRASAETLKKMAAAAKRNSTPEYRAAMSERITEWWRQRKESHAYGS